MENPSDTAKPRWGQARRLAFIDLRLQYEGRINRRDLKTFFQISTPQASADLEIYRKSAPANMTYDASARMFVALETFVPQYGRSAATNYLDDLSRLANGVVEKDEVFEGFVPPTGVVATPSRAIGAPLVAALVRAIRDRLALRITYQSMDEPTPAQRVISPHALGFDGLRWHTRAWCHQRRVFRDFAIGRLTVEGTAEVDEPAIPANDVGWQTMVDIILIPHPGLTPSQRDVVMRDYEMTGGKRVVSCRKAMLFYTLRHLNLDSPEVLENAARQHVIVENRSDVDQWIQDDRRLA